MTPGETREQLRISIQAQLARVKAGHTCGVPMLWGKPGIGKSHGVVRPVADELGLRLIDVRLAQLDPVDLRGIPWVGGEADKNGVRRAHWALPDFLPTEGEGVLFLDELPQAPAVFNAASELILDRKIGKYKLPDGWAMVAAGNNRADRANASELPTHLKNRLIHFDVEADLQEWTDWALGAGVDGRVIAFLQWRPNLLHKFEPADNAFPSPRSWEFVSDGCKTLSGQPQDHIPFNYVLGAVGKGAASEFQTFIKVYRDLPKLEVCFSDPKRAPFPKEPNARYALTIALGQAVNQKPEEGATSKKTPYPIEGFFDYIEQQMSAEFQVLAVLTAWKRSALSGPRYVKWASANKSLVTGN